ncbi:MAG: AmmeMemoRadiSam system radical SAM enzyme [Candidatus Micrarchaeota archaeon]|nr:AmmeMemoRadiSam system radical SAM enzyme [Candidatus Micrarchaeota archaeon]
MDSVARLWKGSGNGKVECTACARRCRIPEGSNGFCFVRQNHNGKLRLVNYGKLEAIQIDPIEKKPFNHFMPGSYVLGVGTSSCNWGCLFCQNHNISKEREINGRDVTPEEVVGLALENNAQCIAFTYNEPTIFIEYAIDVAGLAHMRGLYNLFVTNGYMTEEAVELMKGNIDAAVINLKGNGEQKFSNKYEVVMSNKPVKESLVRLKDSGIHVEITDLIIPGVGDSLKACDELTGWIADNLGTDTPLQFTRFHPDYKMLDSSVTPYQTLEKHYDVAKRNGLDYVYIGNVPGNPHESTYCPSCNSEVIKRYGHYITGYGIDSGGKCKNCSFRIPVFGRPPKVFRYESVKALY